jgi:hypothetical protein
VAHLSSMLMLVGRCLFCLCSLMMSETTQSAQLKSRWITYITNVLGRLSKLKW